MEQYMEHNVYIDETTFTIIATKPNNYKWIVLRSVKRIYWTWKATEKYVSSFHLSSHSIWELKSLDAQTEKPTTVSKSFHL